MDTLLGQLVFCVGSEEYRWDDVILAAKLRGDWAGLEKKLCEGLACVKRMDEAEEEIDAEELESVANDFRYERDLVTAEEADAWLNRWDLSAEAWMDYIGRYLLRRKWADELAEIVARCRITKRRSIAASRRRRSAPVIWRASPRRSRLGHRRLTRRGKRFGFAKQRKARRG